MTEQGMRLASGDARGIQSLVESQFGPQAAAYVLSSVHAAGADLDALAAAVAGRGLETALDLGCGGGHVSFTLAPHVGQVSAYDLSAAMLAAVKVEAARRGLANITTQEGCAEALPFAAESFDLVVSRYSAHHWSDLPAGLGAARRVVKARGRVVMMDVIAPAHPVQDSFLQTVELLRDPSHVRDYALAQWRALALAAGFAVERVETRRLRLEFQSWITRLRTDPLHVAAIRSLQALVPDTVRDHFEIEPDGSFTVDTATLVLTPA